MELLSKKHLEETMSVLTEEQKDYLENRLKIRRKSEWLQILATYKGVDITDDMNVDEIEDKIDDWILIDCMDGGYKRKPYKCDCGQPLRFQYIIQNKKAGEVRKLGENCFEKYLSLPASVIKDVKSGMYNIDLERDEILTKLRQKVFFPLSNYLHLKIPPHIIEQYELGLPLLDRQIHLVEKINVSYKEEKKLSRLFDRLDSRQKAYVSKMNQNERRELLLSLENGFIAELIPDEELPDFDECIKKQIELQLPLLKEQQEIIKDYKIKKKREKYLNRLTEEQKNWFLEFNLTEQNEILEKVNETPYYKINQVKVLPISEEIITQLQFNLPLLNRHLTEIRFAKVKINELKNANSSITFGMLMDRHLETLRAIREKEKAIPQNLMKDWLKIQELSSNLQNGAEFDYGQFKLLLSNLIIPLRVESDPYL